MTRRTLIFIAAVAVAAVAGCYTGPNSELSPATQGPGTSADGTLPTQGTDDNGTLPDGAAPVATGLPCDVAKVLAASCTGCHGARPSKGAPNSLVTYEDLAAPSKTDPSHSVAVLSVDRMNDAKDPMPPDGKLDASDVAILSKWVTAGMPRGACGTKSAADAGPAADGGPVADGGPHPADGGPGAASVCTSGTTWPAGAAASELMHPGKQCLACHASTGGPTYAMAGTIYPTLHEPNDCNGSNGNLSVLIIDATGKSHTIPVNSAGNFFRVTSLPMPYRAMIVDGAKVREMKTPQTDGDCNGCHSETSTRSPGRVLAP